MPTTDGEFRCDRERCDHPDGWHFTVGEMLAIAGFFLFICWIVSIS